MTIPDTIERLAQHETDTAERASDILRRLSEQRYRTAQKAWIPQYAMIVEAGGGIYKPGVLGDLVLFDSPATHSTLALHEADLTPDAVRRHIAESNARFGVRE